MVLKAYWPLDETSGSTAKDVRGGNDGTVNGATLGANGILGNTAYDFDGSDDYVSITQPLDGTTPYTVSLWSNHRSPSDGYKESDMYTRVGQELVLRGEGDGTYTFYHHTGSGYVSTPSASISGDNWNFWVGVYDGSNIYLYKNASEVGSTSVSSSGDSDGTENFIGAASSSSNAVTDGRIAEVRIYDHALTQQEIQYLYQVGRRGRLVSGKRQS